MQSYYIVTKNLYGIDYHVIRANDLTTQNAIYAWGIAAETRSAFFTLDGLNTFLRVSEIVGYRVIKLTSRVSVV